jgi:Flp pilus assembly protein TadD
LAISWAVMVVASAPTGLAAPGPVHDTPQRSEEAFIRAAEAAAQASDLNSASAFYQRAAQLAPKDPKPLADLGALMARTGALAAAVEAYRGALARSPSDWRIELELGRLALRLDRPQDALGHFETVKRTQPQPAVYNGIGVTEDLLGDHAAAQSAYREGLRETPDDPTLRNNLGLSQALAGNYSAAIATLSALTASPHASARYRLNLALVYGLAGQDDAAAAAARDDLGDAEIASNRHYYQTLRALGDHARAAAILGVGAQPRSPPSGSPPPR